MFQGSFVAIITPMLANGEVDYNALANLIEWHVEQKTHGIVSVGTTGESATLTPKEHIEVIGFTVQQVKGRIKVVAGTGSNSTSEAIELSQAARDKNADACLSVVPYYNKPSQHGLLLHYQAIADAVDIGQILYNVPSRTITDLHPATAIELAKHKNIIGIKDASGDIGRIKLYQENTSNFVVLTGEDGHLYDFLSEGGNGIISVTANVVPNHISKICTLAKEKNFSTAKKLFSQLTGLNDVMFCEANPIPVKYALWKMQKCSEYIRLPLTRLEEDNKKLVDQQLFELGLIS